MTPRGQQDLWEVDATGVRGEGDASRDRVPWPVVSGLLLVRDTEWRNEVPDYQGAEFKKVGTQGRLPPGCPWAVHAT